MLLRDDNRRGGVTGVLDVVVGVAAVDERDVRCANDDRVLRRRRRGGVAGAVAVVLGLSEAMVFAPPVISL